MSKPPLILSPGFLLSNTQSPSIQNFRASASTGALHFSLEESVGQQMASTLLGGLETNHLALQGSLISLDPVTHAWRQLSYFLVYKTKLGQRSRAAFLSARICGIHMCHESMTLPRGQSGLWSFLVCIFEEDTSMSVGVDGFFCKVRGCTVSLLFPRSIAETGSDAAFRSNHLKLTFAIAKLFI